MMIDLECLATSNGAIYYHGEYHYRITQDRTGYAVHVMHYGLMDAEGGPIPGETYAASSLSTALATVERLEAGEPE